MAGRTTCTGAGHRVIGNAYNSGGAFAGGQQVLGGHSQTAASHTVHGQAKGIVQLQRAVTIAGGIAPGHEIALRLHSGA